MTTKINKILLTNVVELGNYAHELSNTIDVNPVIEKISRIMHTPETNPDKQIAQAIYYIRISLHCLKLLLQDDDRESVNESIEQTQAQTAELANSLGILNQTQNDNQDLSNIVNKFATDWANENDDVRKIINDRRNTETI